MVISKFQNSFSALQAILRYPNSFLGTINDSGILHCTQTIKIINYSVIKCQKNGAKMNKIVQKWQFQKTFYTTMETVLGFSQNRLAELFQNYVFSTNQYLYFDLYVAECQIQFFWPASRFGVYVSIVMCASGFTCRGFQLLLGWIVGTSWIKACWIERKTEKSTVKKFIRLFWC